MSRSMAISLNQFVCLLNFYFTSTVNSLGHDETVSNPTHAVPVQI